MPDLRVVKPPPVNGELEEAPAFGLVKDVAEKPSSKAFARAALIGRLVEMQGERDLPVENPLTGRLGSAGEA